MFSVVVFRTLGENDTNKVDFAMSVEQGSRNERFVAVGALVGSLSGVVTFVNDESGMLGEGFSAGMTIVWFFAGVSSFVNDEGGAFVEGFTADVANERFLAAVKAKMILEGAFRRYDFVAQIAREFVLPGVRLDVNDEGVFVGENFAADFALMLNRPEIGLVHLGVSRERVIVGKSLSTGMTNVLVGCVFHVHVAMAFGIREETFTTHVAETRVFLEMSSLVRGQLRRLHESSPANVAHEISFVRVNPTMDREGVCSFERFVTNVTFVRSRLTVRDQMTFVQVFRPKNLRANVTFVKILRPRFPGLVRFALGPQHSVFLRFSSLFLLQPIFFLQAIIFLRFCDFSPSQVLH